MNTLRSIFANKDLRKKILFTVSILLLFRILAHIPMPGVQFSALRDFFARNELFGLLNLFTGGSMENFSLVLMGVGPYITASIIFQLLVVIVPKFEELKKEGQQGQQKINQYTRLATVPLALLQGYSMIFLLRQNSILTNLTPIDLLTILATVTAGTIFVMWLGELISEQGIGNGISLLITVSILVGIPSAFSQTLAVADAGAYLNIAIFVALTVATIIAIVFVNEAERQVPVTYAKRVRGADNRSGVATYLPLKVIMAGVIPIIFAISMMIFPPIIARLLMGVDIAWLANGAQFVDTLFQNNTFYAIAYFGLTVMFTYFYTFVIFQPEQVAENLQKQGGFITGVRPGKETAQYLGKVLNRLTLFGSIFLAAIAVSPILMQNVTNVQTMVLGGTGILIMVSVTLDTMRQIKAQLITRQYEF